LNGNMLLNVGPAADGTISTIFMDRLFGIVEWLTVNGDVIYATRPWKACQKENTVYYTTKKDTLYAIVTAWPRGNRLVLQKRQTTGETTVQMLGWNRPLKWTVLEKGTTSHTQCDSVPARMDVGAHEHFQSRSVVAESHRIDLYIYVYK
jgi:alpha-L-fucosidase